MRMTRGDGIVSITRLSILALGALSDRMLPIWENDKAKNNRFVFGEQIVLQLDNTAPKVSSLWNSGSSRLPACMRSVVLAWHESIFTTVSTVDKHGRSCGSIP
jgi:hypothetical protein